MTIFEIILCILMFCSSIMLIIIRTSVNNPKKQKACIHKSTFTYVNGNHQKTTCMNCGKKLKKLIDEKM